MDGTRPLAEQPAPRPSASCSVVDDRCRKPQHPLLHRLQQLRPRSSIVLAHMNLDEVDRELLSLVQADARSTLAKLASRTRP